MNILIIVGAGGFALEVAAYAEDVTHAHVSGYTIKGYLDDTKQVGMCRGGYPVLGNTDMPVDKNALYIVAVGMPESRKLLTEKLAAKGAKFTTIIHQLSYVAENAQIGAGSIVAPFAFVGPEAHVGKHCVLNVHSCVAHESRIGTYSVLSPYAATHGGAVLSSGVFMGSNAIITAKQHIGENATIAAGAVVYNEIPAGKLAMGNPAAHRST